MKREAGTTQRGAHSGQGVLGEIAGTLSHQESEERAGFLGFQKHEFEPSHNGDNNRKAKTSYHLQVVSGLLDT